MNWIGPQNDSGPEESLGQIWITWVCKTNLGNSINLRIFPLDLDGDISNIEEQSQRRPAIENPSAMKWCLHRLFHSLWLRGNDWLRDIFQHQFHTVSLGIRCSACNHGRDHENILWYRLAYPIDVEAVLEIHLRLVWSRIGPDAQRLRQRKILIYSLRQA